MTDVVRLDEVDRSSVGVVGGKAAGLGELSRVHGVRVPDGFCVTTDVFRRVVGVRMEALLDRLSPVGPEEPEALRAIGADIRRAIDAIEIPADVATSITAVLDGLAGDAFAVRSSATAEDLPTASFAGQHDSFLGVPAGSVVESVRRCWASLFTERAITYRLRHGIDHRHVGMAVVVQELVPALASGVLFTADPTTGNRTVASVEATAGLGEALVSGHVAPDTYTVRRGQITAGEGSTLRDEQVLELVELGRRIEDHVGGPQDIEWCLAADGFHVVQSRPITTLFPIPERDDDADHVYVSVGHQQMMTDAMKPLGISMWQLSAGRPMFTAGGRIFVDVTTALSSPGTRAGVIGMLGRSDPLIGDALGTAAARDGFLPTLPDPPPPAGGPPPPIETDPAIVHELIAARRDSVEALAAALRPLSGPALLDFVLEHVPQVLGSDPRSLQVVMAAYDAARWLDEHLHEWLGERGAADRLTQSVPHNVTSEMGLALLDVADAIRPHADVVAFLRDVDDDRFLDELPDSEGGRAAREAIEGYLDRYGMRCVGEIDITRPRWREQPRALLPMILANVENFESGEAARRFEQGRRDAQQVEDDLLGRLRALPDGARKADETKRMIDRLRTFAGYREHPKYWMMGHYLVYKQALLAEADRLVDAGVLDDTEDVFFLTVPELADVVRTGQVDDELVRERKEAFRWHETLTPPRVLTSEGEAIAGAYRRDDVPAGALVGLGVSAGTAEGRARVVLDMADADLEPGDILVTVHTDPSWSPLFLTVAGLVTEVGGLTTHGAVVAREYGLPAVVGLERATQVIQDGQRIRVDGSNGLVEVLPAGWTGAAVTRVGRAPRSCPTDRPAGPGSHRDR